MDTNVLTATEFRGIVPKGGSTKPWVVEAYDTAGNTDLYVVKMFTAKQVRQQNAVAKEVFGNVLAQSFSLPVPDFAFVRFEEAFLETLPDEYREIEQNTHRGLRFGSRFASGYAIFDDALPATHLDPITMGSVYAFDNLVRNLDRGGFRKKPNLLIRDGDFLLIDHEQIFPFADDPEHYNDAPIRDFQAGKWAYPYQVHLFYKYLQGRSQSQKEILFRNFIEQLRVLDLFLLEEYAQYLTENNQPVGNLELILDYLAAIKDAPEPFAALLQQQLT